MKMKLKTIMACGRDVYFDYQLIDACTGKTLIDRVCDKTNIKSGDEEWIDHCKYEPYKMKAGKAHGFNRGMKNRQQ